MAPQPITIHVYHGRFLVWDESVCRELAFQYRILGQWKARKQNSISNSSAFPTMSNPYPIETLPLYLHPVQVVFLLHSVPSHLLFLVPSSSVESVRIATKPTLSLINRARLEQFKVQIEKHADHAERMAKKYEHVRKQRKNEGTSESVSVLGEQQSSSNDISMQHARTRNGITSDSATEQQSLVTTLEAASESEIPPAKRHKGAYGTTAATAAECRTPAATAASSSTDRPLTSLVPSSSCIPSSSSFHLLTCTFPLTTENITATSHPTFHTVNVQPPLKEAIKLAKHVGAVDLPLVLSRLVDMTNFKQTPEGKEQLVYDSIYDSLGISLHRPDECLPGASPCSLPSTLVSFLSHYWNFSYLHSCGFYLLPGLHFGCDWMCYERFPSRVHASYMVKVLSISETEASEPLRLDPFEESSLIRIAAGVNKILLVMQPIVKISKFLEENGKDGGKIGPSSSAFSLFSPVSFCSLLRSIFSSFSLSSITFRCYTAQWISPFGVKRSDFPNEEERKAAMRRKDEAREAGQDAEDGMGD